MMGKKESLLRKNPLLTLKEVADKELVLNLLFLFAVKIRNKQIFNCFGSSRRHISIDTSSLRREKE